MRILRIALVLAIIFALPASSGVFGQAYYASFISSITYQNVGTGTANIQFQFYNQGATSPTATINKTLSAGAGDSYLVSSLSNTFAGSVVIAADQDIVATIVQIPQGSPLKNRPISNAPRAGGSKVLLASVLKNKFNVTSKFSIQNVASYNVNLTVKFYDINNPSSPITVNRSNVAPGVTVYFAMGNLPEISVASFEGSAVVEAVKSGTNYPAPIVGTVLELSTSTASNTAVAFEGVSRGFIKLFMATALCDAFGTRTAYAVQNVSSAALAATVTYSNGTSQTKNISAGAKQSFFACDVAGTGFSGAATIVSTGDIIAIGKAYKPNIPYTTAFLGESRGASKVAITYVRYTSDANYNSGARQRTFIAIQNVGASNATNVTVKYLNKNGTVVGTHTIGTIGPNAKANSSPISAGTSPQLIEFGQPDYNPGGGYGGAALVEGTGELIAIARVTSRDTGINQDVAEDYNGIPLP